MTTVTAQWTMNRLVLCHFIVITMICRFSTGSPITPDWLKKNFSVITELYRDEHSNEATSCHLKGRYYVHGDHVVHTDPCETCMCFRGDVLCWRRVCPPNAKQIGCKEIKEQGRCCPFYQCPQNNYMPKATTAQNSTTVFKSNPTKATNGCHLAGRYYQTLELIQPATSPCLECRCGVEGNVVCLIRQCSKQSLRSADSKPKPDKPVVKIHPPRLYDLKMRGSM